MRVEAALRLGDTVSVQAFGHFLAAFVQKGLVGHLDAGRTLAVDDDEFQPLAAHHRAQPAAARVAGGTPLHVVKGDARVAVAIFAGYADAGHMHIAKALVYLGKDVVQILARVLFGREELDLRLAGVQGDVSHPIPFLLGLPFHHQRLDPHARHRRGPTGAGVGLFDSAGERGFASHRQTGRGGCRGAGHNAGGKDQLVVSAEEMAGRGDLITNHGGREPSTTKNLVLLRHILKLPPLQIRQAWGLLPVP